MSSSNPKSQAQRPSRDDVTEQPRPEFPPQDIQPPGVEEHMDPAPRYEAAWYRPAGKLEGKVALITGGDSGIGRAVAWLYAREGADVAIVYLPEEAEDAGVVRERIEGIGRRCLCLPGDVSDPSFCARMVRDVVDAYGRLDILVNNAAFQNHVGGIEELSAEQWDWAFRTNIYPMFHTVKAALPHLSEGAVILNTGSILGFEGSKGLIDYSSTKGAIHAFTKALAQDMSQRGVRVNCVSPGPVWTPLNPAERSDDEVRSFGAGVPYGRPAQPEEIAPAYVFLAAPDSNYITGEVVTCLGGTTRAG